jgi:nitroimidazol reductase NimA-like FMN-containing flavoprotein (pyridoxamine 5'-phosphate oxidase superfamily)
MALTIGPRLSEFLSERLLAVVATPGEHDLPEMTPIWFEYNDGYIWFNGERTRRWLQRMDLSRRATCLLLDPDNGWRWVQLYGRVVEVSDDPESARFSRLAERYGRPLARPVPNRVFVRVEITSVKGRAGTPAEHWDVAPKLASSG